MDNQDGRKRTLNRWPHQISTHLTGGASRRVIINVTSLDSFIRKGDRLGTRSNYSGGVQGGISNGEPVVFRVAFKPPATIGLPQTTATFDGEEVVLEAHGRHDPCVVPRAVPIVEAMTALVLADFAMCQNGRQF